MARSRSRKKNGIPILQEMDSLIDSKYQKNISIDNSYIKDLKKLHSHRVSLIDVMDKKSFRKIPEYEDAS